MGNKDDKRKGKVITEKERGDAVFTTLEVSNYIKAFEKVKWPNQVVVDGAQRNEVK